MLLLSGKDADASVVAQHYARTMTLIRQKAQVKLHPNLKRITCTRCNSMLFFGTGTRLRIRRHGNCSMCVTCKRCGAIKRFRCGREHLLAIESAELNLTKKCD
uniref:Ribonuclease P protein component 4 n=1 Tax=Trichuris muris TaxID=70415 RepID=A0A5S6QWW5_TRIMR